MVGGCRGNSIKRVIRCVLGGIKNFRWYSVEQKAVEARQWEKRLVRNQHDTGIRDLHYSVVWRGEEIMLSSRLRKGGRKKGGGHLLMFLGRGMQGDRREKIKWSDSGLRLGVSTQKRKTENQHQKSKETGKKTLGGGVKKSKHITPNIKKIFEEG